MTGLSAHGDSVIECITHCPIRILIGILCVDRPIYDETRLTGFYDSEITSSYQSQTNDPQAITPRAVTGLVLSEA
jgi:hypothetical protein